MKKLLLVAMPVVILAACNTSPKADEAKAGDTIEASATTAGTSYKLDTSSTVLWTGSKPTGSHTGSFKISDGNLQVDNETVTGGAFTIDMTTITNHDLAGDPENKGKLEGHLKSADFFDVEKYPTAKFEITNITPFTADAQNSASVLPNATHTITGNFTLKDSTKSVSFPAKITLTDNSATAIADFNIDRTNWGISYKGPNNPQDWVISKTVNIKLNISATR